MKFISKDQIQFQEDWFQNQYNSLMIHDKLTIYYRALMFYEKCKVRRYFTKHQLALIVLNCNDYTSDYEMRKFYSDEGMKAYYESLNYIDDRHIKIINKLKTFK